MGMKMREPFYKEPERIDVKPDVSLLKQQMAASLAASQSVPVTAPISLADSSVPTTPVTTEPPKTTSITPTPLKKKGGLEAAISKLKGQQEQALAQQMLHQPISSQEPAEEKRTDKPKFDQEQSAPPQLEPRQLDRAK